MRAVSATHVPEDGPLGVVSAVCATHGPLRVVSAVSATHDAGGHRSLRPRSVRPHTLVAPEKYMLHLDSRERETSILTEDAAERFSRARKKDTSCQA